MLTEALVVGIVKQLLRNGVIDRKEYDSMLRNIKSKSKDEKTEGIFEKQARKQYE